MGRIYCQIQYNIKRTLHTTFNLLICTHHKTNKYMPHNQ